MTEENKPINNENDKTYKSFLTNKKSFVEFLQSFVNETWVNMIDEKDLELVNKNFVLKDYDERESDIIYKIKLKEQEIYFYVLLELQSSVDFTMPFRLLIYMTELWKQLFLNTDQKERERKDYRLPAVVPLLLYNGKNNWTVNMSFKEMQQGYEWFGEHLVDFKYLLFDINRYKDEELIEIGNLIAAVFMLDKSGDIKLFAEKFKKLSNITKKLNKDQWALFKNWIKVVILPKLSGDIKMEFAKVIESIEPEESDKMVMNLEIALDEMEERAEKRKSIEIARKFIDMGIDVKKISEGTGLTVEEVEKLKEE